MSRGSSHLIQTLSLVAARQAAISCDVCDSVSFLSPPSRNQPGMAKVAPSSLLAVGGGDAFAVQPSRNGTGLFRNRVIAVRRPRISANLGGNGEVKPGGKKKFITREEEPEQYWQAAGERKGENPMKTPLPYIIIFGMSTPFVILAIAFANGWIKVPVR